MIQRALLVAWVIGVSVLASGCTLGGGPLGGPGSAAGDLVSGKRYPDLLVEIDHPPGHAPHPDALSTLNATLREVTGKRSVKFTLDASIPLASGKRYTWSEISSLEARHRDHRTSGDTAVLYVVYVAGGSEDDTESGRVLGAVYRGTSIVMFEGNIRAAAEGSLGGLVRWTPEHRFVERAVLVHELGHALGLVNKGADMVRPHEDPEHPGHSSNRQSVMYWAVENTAGLLNTFTRGSDIPFQFDADDKADLRALREA